MKRRLGGSLRERKVAVLGLAFKRDTDDERDSLSHKLVRLLERELADVAVHDPRGGDADARRSSEAVDDADVVVVATNHSEFERPGGAGADRRPRRGRLPRRRPLERARRRPGLRLRRTRSPR